MKENKYNNSHFFSQYSQMSRSVEGLERSRRMACIAENAP